MSKKKLTLEVIVDQEISFRDIERTLNVLDAETELVHQEEVEDDV
jgi:hypothetical protein